MKRILITLTTLLILLLPVGALGATYYVANGGDDTAAGTELAPWAHCPGMSGWAPAASGNSITTGDTVSFAQSDTWTFTPTGDATWSVTTTNLTINSYNNGGGTAKPIFDSQVLFTSNPLTGARVFWHRFMRISASGVTINGIEIKRFYGSGIAFMNGANNGTIEYCKLHDLGMGGVTRDVNTGVVVNYITVQYCEIADAQRLEENGYISYGWTAAINLNASAGSGYGSIARYNYIHNIYGEGIICDGATVEYNVIEDTMSYAVHASPHAENVSEDTNIRYNLIIQYALGSGFHGGTSVGIGMLDEVDGYTVTGDFNVYGNIVIGAQYGILWRDSENWEDPWAANVRIYNNTLIDSTYRSFYITDTDRLTDGGGSMYIYNNASIYFDESGDDHIADDATIPNIDVTISNNFFWDETAGSYGTVDEDWDTNYVTGDPKLPGEPAVNWDGLTGRSDVDFDTHLYPASDSALVDTGYTFPSLTDYAVSFLTHGTDYDDLPGTATFMLLVQGDYGLGWDIGAVIYQAASEDPPLGNNDFSTDPDCFALYNVEASATFTTDSKGGNTLVAGAAPDQDLVNFKQGTGSANFEADNSDYYYVTDANLDANFPLKVGDSQKIISVSAWIKPESDHDGMIWTKWKAQGDERSLAFRLNTTLGNPRIELLMGFNGGASEEKVIHASTVVVDGSTAF